MPWRLVQFIVIFVAFLLFVMLNLENRSDVSLGFASFEDVPVFITAFFAFIFGMTLTLPVMANLWLKARKGGGAAKKRGKDKGESKGATDRQESGPSARQEEPSAADLKDYGID